MTLYQPAEVRQPAARRPAGRKTGTYPQRSGGRYKRRAMPARSPARGGLDGSIIEADATQGRIQPGRAKIRRRG
jgi:hypothetical protein